jgi:L-rhamnose mutarotase
MSRLEIKDPVFAAYLLSKRCKLQGIEPSSKSPPEPKRYIFDEAVKSESHEADFLGIAKQPADTTWRNFIDQMNNLQIIEDQLLRQITNRPKKIGVEARSGNKETVFVTSDQGVAAFLLTHNVGMWLQDVQEMGKDRGHLFIFSEYKEAQRLYTQMLNSRRNDSWWNMKCAYKRATSMRRALLRNGE